MRLRYTLPALADLNAILDYIAAHSPQGARRVQARIQTLTDLLSRPECPVRPDSSGFAPGRAVLGRREARVMGADLSDDDIDPMIEQAHGRSSPSRTRVVLDITLLVCAARQKIHA